LPSSDTHRSSAPRSIAPSVTSTRSTSTRGAPAARHCSPTSVSCSTLRAARHSARRREASARASAAPMPCDAPLMKAAGGAVKSNRFDVCGLREEGDECGVV
jgi:hypothetical protein